MKWLKRILWTLAVLVALVVVSIAVVYYLVTAPIPPAKGYQPPCAQDDLACGAWLEFRRSHPFPYQAIAAKAKQSNVVVVIAEPPPHIEKSDVDTLVKKVFGESAIAKRQKWMIGDDGWLEDLVVTWDAGTADAAAIQAQLRDRVAVLHMAFFGTTYGGEVEQIVDRAAGTSRLDVPSYHVTPKELGAWLADSSLGWQSLERLEATTMSWRDISASHHTGAFASSDGRLVMLAFPTTIFAEGTDSQRVLAGLRAPFREFAVASEGVVGGVWTRSGQVALVSRARTTPRQSAPPLRYETFATLAAAARKTEELAQSYERTQPFAGKVQWGPYSRRDWAPIYLSPELIDTELGALLNVTDQMLKSWSSAGEVEYLYFDYAKPSSFPFGNESLGDIVRAKTGETSLLFNWNTAGSAVIVRRGADSILTSAQSGSLPVTYRAGGKTAAEGGAELHDYEHTAYEYFSSLRNPELQRVVQYTVIYQLLRAVARDNPSRDAGAMTASAADPPEDPPSAGRALLVESTQRLLYEVSTRPASFGSGKEVDTLKRFIDGQGSLGEQGLAALLADRNSAQARHYMNEAHARMRKAAEELDRRGRTLKDGIDSYNRKATQNNAAVAAGRPAPHAHAAMAAEETLLTMQQNALERDAEQFEKSRMSNSLEEATEALSILAAATDLEKVQTEYVKRSAREPRGSVKTPSIVVSWHSKDTFWHVGGHNLNSRALRFEISPEVAGIAITEGADGRPVLRYPPSQADAVERAAPKLARAFEHRGERDLDNLKALLNEGIPVRGRDEALHFATETTKPIESAAVFAKLGSRVYTEKNTWVDDLRSMAGNNDCCLYVAHDAKRNAYIAEPNLKPPPGAKVYEILDSPSLVGELRRLTENPATKDRATVFLDEPEGYVESIMRTLAKGDTDLSSILTHPKDGGNGAPPRTSLFAQPGFDGKPSWLKSLFQPVETAKRVLFGHLANRVPGNAWKTASVESMQAEQVRTHLEALGWNEARDGIPVGVKVSLQDTSGATRRDMAVIAGVDPTKVPASESMLRTAGQNAAEDAALRGASPGQYLIAVRERLAKLSDLQLRRLVLVMESDDSRMYFTRRHTYPEEHAHGRRDAG